MRGHLLRSTSPALAVLAALSLGCGSYGGPSPLEARVMIVQNAVSKATAGFSPNPLAITLALGTRVTWVNRDYTSSTAGGTTGTSHFLVSDQGLFDSGELKPQSKFSFTFPGPGTYTYRCLKHPTMIGTITISQQ